MPSAQTPTGIIILKSTGEPEPFDSAKLMRSLRRSGASAEDAEVVRREVEAFLFPGITTREIYRRAFSILQRRSQASAARYRLRDAIEEFGPSGYPFERYVAELLKYEGYKVQVGVMLRGHCVHHEVDVIAEQGKRRIMVECKFSTDHRTKCDVKVPLYIQSRFLDLRKQFDSDANGKNVIHHGWIVTNTRFTEDAIQYAQCCGLFLIGWDYPERSGLKDRIDASRLHPLTCLSTLKHSEKQRLLDGGHVLVRDIGQDEAVLAPLRLSESRRRAVLEEARSLL